MHLPDIKSHLNASCQLLHSSCRTNNQAHPISLLHSALFQSDYQFSMKLFLFFCINTMVIFYKLCVVCFCIHFYLRECTTPAELVLHNFFFFLLSNYVGIRHNFLAVSEFFSGFG